MARGLRHRPLGRVDLRAGIDGTRQRGTRRPLHRPGGRVSSIELPPTFRSGPFADTVYRSSTITLEPGDRFVFVTDGMLERQAAGLDLARRSQDPRCCTPAGRRALADRVLRRAGGVLSDDATVLCLDWHGGHGRDRDTRHGANR